MKKLPIGLPVYTRVKNKCKNIRFVERGNLSRNILKGNLERRMKRNRKSIEISRSRKDTVSTEIDAKQIGVRGAAFKRKP